MLSDEEFSAIAEKYMDSIFRLALNYMRSRTEADDITQNVLIKLYRTEKKFQSGDHLRCWLVRVTVNTCKNLRRSPWRARTVGLETVAERPAFQPEEGGVLEEVQKLPTKYREVLVLYYYLGYDTNEIGTMLGIRPDAVRARMSRARLKLKSRLEGLGYG